MRALRYIAAILVLAIGFHLATIWLMPRVLLAGLTTSLQIDGTPLNALVHLDRRSADDRAIVRPSPDMLYSICLYDLSAGPIRIATAGMPETYWSLSGFAANTDNFFVVNDRQAGGRPVDILINHRAQAREQRQGLRRGQGQSGGGADYYSPSMRGVILLRMVIENDLDLPALDVARASVVCQPAM
jgi:uncharacterized membrane protein